MSADLTALKAAVEQEKTVESGVLTLLQGLAAQVAALEPTQESIDALTAEINGNIATMQAAITANTPAATPPAAAPAAGT